jgi:hypothetical protein
MDPPGWADVGYGLNEKGIAVTTNAGNPNDNATIGLPPNIMLRRVLEEAATLEEAVGLFEDWLDNGTGFGTGGAILHIADFNQNKIAKIQLRSNVIEVTYGAESGPGAQYVGSANHFVGDFNPDPSYFYESSFERYARLMDLLDNSTEDFNLEQCWTVLRDTNGGAANNNTISRAGGVSKTVFSTIFTPEGMYYSLEPPHLYFEHYKKAQYAGKPAQPSYTFVNTSTVGAVGSFLKLRWTTAYQRPFSRFNIYRSTSRDGGYKKINLMPIWAKGRGTRGAIKPC